MLGVCKVGWTRGAPWRPRTGQACALFSFEGKSWAGEVRHRRVRYLYPTSVNPQALSEPFPGNFSVSIRETSRAFVALALVISKLRRVACRYYVGRLGGGHALVFGTHPCELKLGCGRRKQTSRCHGYPSIHPFSLYVVQ